ncbi:MAG: hypothetical protein ACF8PN_02545 [Phycisphaerales bacterium]
MIFRPPVDPVFVCVMLAVALVMGVVAYRTILVELTSVSMRGAWAGLAVLRTLAIVGVAFIGLGPTTLQERPIDTASGAVHVLIDGSASMCVDDIIVDRRRFTRADLANRWIEKLLDSEVTTSIRLHRIGEEWTPLTGAAPAVAPTDDASRLVDQARRVIQSARPGDEMLLLTDGHDTTEADWISIAEDANERELRVHAAPLGRDDPVADLAVRLLPDRSSVFRDQSLILRGDIRRRGFDEREVTVELYQNDRLIDQRMVRLQQSRTPIDYTVVPTPFDESASSGLAAFRLEVTPLPGERWTENNTRHAFVRVNAERIRVVLFENEPYWDSRYLIAALRRDTQVELTTVIGLGPSERLTRFAPGDESDWAGAPLSTPPVTAEALARFDVIVLGRGIERWFPGSAAIALATFVEARGGAIVFARGRPVGSDSSDAGQETRRILESIAPVRWGDDRATVTGVEVTPEGRSRPPLNFGSLGDTESILTELPGLIARTRVESRRSLSEIWLRAESDTGTGADADADAALVATVQSGNGRTLAVLTDGLWRWAFVSPETDSYRSVYESFWARTVRWLVGAADLLPGQDVALSVDRTAAAPGDRVRITATMRFAPDDWSPPVVIVTLPSGESTPVALSSEQRGPDRFTGEFVPAEEGVHLVEYSDEEVSAAPVTTRFAVHASSVERLETSSRPEELRALAESTGGEVFEHDDWDEFTESIRKTAQARIVLPRPQDAWPRWWFLAALLGLLSSEWLIRRRLGWT